MGELRRKYSSDFKNEVLDRVKNSGKTAIEIANEYGINVQRIYKWIGTQSEPGQPNYILENARLKRQVSELLNIVGELTLESKRRGKK